MSRDSKNTQIYDGEFIAAAVSCVNPNFYGIKSVQFKRINDKICGVKLELMNLVEKEVATAEVIFEGDVATSQTQYGPALFETPIFYQPVQNEYSRIFAGKEEQNVSEK